jgi:DNA-binding NarL/FixJ family response regulator
MLATLSGYVGAMTEMNHPRPLRVTLAHESELVRRGLADMLAPYSDRVVLVPTGADSAPASFVDITLHDSFGDLPTSLEALPALAARPTGGRLVVFTWNPQPDLVRRALDEGAAGCLSKGLPASRLVCALEAVHGGEEVVDAGQRTARTTPPEETLTPREAEVVALITMGLDNNSVARETHLSINSVKSHIRSAYRKMGVTSRSQAVLWGVRHGYLGGDLASLPGAGEPAPALTG